MKKFVAMAMLTTLSMLFCAAPPAEAQKKDITLSTIDIAIKNGEKIVKNANASIKDAEVRIEKAKKDVLDASLLRDKEMKDTYSAGYVAKVAAADAKMAAQKKKMVAEAKLFENTAKDLNKKGITKANIGDYRKAVDDWEAAEKEFRDSVLERKHVGDVWAAEKTAHAVRITDAQGVVEHRKLLLRAAEKELADTRTFLVKAFDAQIETQQAILKTLPNNQLEGELKHARKDVERLERSIADMHDEVKRLRNQPQPQQTQTSVEQYVWQRSLQRDYYGYCYEVWHLVRVR